MGGVRACHGGLRSANPYSAAPRGYSAILPLTPHPTPLLAHSPTYLLFHGLLDKASE